MHGRPLQAGSLSAIAILGLALSGCDRPHAASASGSPAAASVAAPSSTWLTSVRIPDFSFAGYQSGERPVPRVPQVTDATAFGARGDGITDDTKALRAALDATHDGALVLPAGRFVVLDTLRIPRSHVVLRGQGPDATVLVMPRSLGALHPDGDPLHGRLHGFVEARGIEHGISLGRVRLAAKRGDRRLMLEKPPEVAPGERVRLRMDNSDGLLRSLLGASLEPGPQTPKDYDHYVDWVTPIERVEGDTLTLARTLRIDVRPEWGAELLAFQPTLEEIGIEDLAFEFPGTPSSPHLEEEGFDAIYMRGVSNGWVRNVTVTDADNGIVLEECRFFEVGNVRLRAALRAPPSGHHALWVKRSQDCLFADFRIDGEFEDEVTVEAFANGNVFMRGTGVAMALDHHRNAPYENLFTDLDVGSPERLWKSGGDVDRGPHAGVRETLWNVRHRGHPMALPGALRFDRRDDAGWPELNVIQVEGYPPSSPSDGVWVDPAPGAPPNLYEAQRRARLGR